MIRILTLIIAFVCSTVSAQAKYEAHMKSGLAFLQAEKTTEAIAEFEKASAADKAQWLPEYYVALAATARAFNMSDKDEVKALLAKAQAAQDKAVNLTGKNAELVLMQAQIYTAWIAFDPMTYGRDYYPEANDLYNEALALDSINPRVVLCKAEFDLGAARYMGGDTKAICREAERAVQLFATFKPQSTLHPNWGEERIKGVIAQCSEDK